MPSVLKKRKATTAALKWNASFRTAQKPAKESAAHAIVRNARALQRAELTARPKIRHDEEAA